MPVLAIPSPSLPPSIPSYPQAYQSILSRARASMAKGSGGGGLIIMVANDLDGVCAARMLTTLLIADSIPHRLFPVEGYAELEARTSDLEIDQEVHTLIFLSLGSLLPLSSHFLPRFNPRVHIHVLDSHRPWNLENLFGGGLEGRDRIWIWGDDDGTGGRNGKVLEKERKAFEALEYDPQSDSDSDSDDSDDDLPRSESSSSDTDDNDDDDDDDGESPRPRRRRKLNDDGQPKPLSKRKRQEYAYQINKYYQTGTYFGQSVAGTVYMLANALAREDNDLLWLSILGLTHQYISSRIDRDRYDLLQSLYSDEVARLNPPLAPPNHRPSLDPSTSTSSSASVGSAADDLSIRPSEEFRFTLYRHWNLYDAMYHSGYVASKMGIWRDKGKGRLQGMLAKMGFSLTQCHQAYSNMDISLKRQLPTRMESIAPEYGLVELSYPSFTRTYGFRSLPLSAADAVEALQALLEAAVGVRLEVEIAGGKGGGEWFGGSRIWSLGGLGWAGAKEVGEGAASQVGGMTGDEDEDGMAERLAKDEKAWEKCFWASYDALKAGGDVSLLHASLPLCMSLQRAIIRQGSSLIDKSKIASLKWFRLAAITEGPDLALFANPATLSRLALWLVDALRDRLTAMMNANGGSGGEGGEKRRTKGLPVVVACLDERAGTYIVVGVTGAPEYGDVRKNKFGLAFQDATMESAAAAKHDRFDTSVVEVKKEDLASFIESLQLYSTERMG